MKKFSLKKKKKFAYLIQKRALEIKLKNPWLPQQLLTAKANASDCLRLATSVKTIPLSAQCHTDPTIHTAHSHMGV